jgi:hypothetical protein
VPKQRKFALRLRARGFSDGQIARLRTPLGVPIGAETPEEIALSAMGEIVAARRGVSPEHGWTPPVRPAVAPAEAANDPELAPGRVASGAVESTGKERAR